MKIYFAGSIRAGREDAELYSHIIEHLKKYGEVLTEHVGEKNLILSEDYNTDKYIHDKDMKWLISCDVVVAEVTIPSLGVGYEIGRAIEHGKKVLCLYRPKEGKRPSAMIAGSKDLTFKEYRDLEQAKKIIDKYFKAN